MEFRFFSPVRIVFGPKTLNQLPSLVPGPARRALVVIGSRPQGASRLMEMLRAAKTAIKVLQQTGEPTVDQAAEGAKAAKRFNADLVIAMGGGSVLDIAKAISALATARDDIHEYLEVIGNAKPFEHPPLPLAAIPTTSGTGAEVTANAVLMSREHRVKVSMRSPLMYPDVAVVDPELTVSMPPSVTACTGMDALTQLLETFVSPFSGPITDALCREGLVRIARSLSTAVQSPNNLDARSDMSLAALFSGMTLANAKLGAVHGIAGPLGGMIPVPHGLICAHFLAPVMEANIRSLRAADPKSNALERYLEVARLLTGTVDADPMAGASWIRDLHSSLNLPGTDSWEMDDNAVTKLSSNALKASSMKGNPISLSREQVMDIINTVLVSNRDRRPS